MAINLHCPICKSDSTLRSRKCKKCDHSFAKGKKYRVVVKTHEGKRVTKITEAISVAKQLEAKFKTQSIEKSLLGILESPTIDRIWEQFLAWAKDNKRSWREDQNRWDLHIKKHLAGKKMHIIKPYDIQNILKEMKSRRDYAPATIKHVVVEVKRVYNWAIEMGLYKGENPASNIL